MPGPGDLKKRSSSFSSFKLKMQGKTVSLTATFKEVASNKTVDLDGLGKAVEIVGCERPPNLAELLAQHDADGDGKLTLDQFKAILKALMAGGGVEYDGRNSQPSTPRDSMSEDLVESSLMRIDAQRAAQAEEAAAAPEPAVAPPEPAAAPEPAAEPAAAAPADDSEEAPLAEGWEAVVDDDGRTYFWHERTDSVTWERPVEGAPAVLKAAAAPDASSPAEAAPAPWEAAKAEAAAEEAPTPERRPSVKELQAQLSQPTGLTRQRSQSESAAAPNKAILSQLKRAGITDAAPSAAGPAAAGSGRLPQAQLAKAALERKSAAEAYRRSSGGATQHAQALRGLQAAQEAGAGTKASTQHERAKASIERRLEGAATGKSTKTVVNGGVGGSQAAAARAALFQKKEEEASAGKVSAREEAMRRLNGKGVVSKKEAFQTQSTKGSQHAAAMSAFAEAGKDISQGGPKKTDFKAPTYAAGPAKNTGVAADGSSTQRAEAMKAMGLM